MKKKILSTCILLALAGCGASEESASGSSASNSQPNKISVSRTSLEVKEGDSVNSNEKFTITASRNADKNIVVSFKTIDGTAIAGQDYVGLDSTVTILEGARSAEVTLSTIANTTHQPNREFTFKITNVAPQGGKAELSTDTAVIRVMDDDPEPLVNFSNAKTTAHEDIGIVDVPVQLDRLSSKETLVKLSLKGIATRDTDFTIASLDLKIPPMTSSANFPVTILKDKLVEGTETIDLTMSQISNANLGKQITSTIFIAGDLRLPDTGVVTYYYNGNFNSKVPDSNHPYQDAMYGHDTDPTYNQNGEAGFVYTKIDNAGNSLASSAQHHRCTYDNHTGLTWEVKDTSPPTVEVDDKGNQTTILSIYSQESKYLWLNRDNKVNGGSAGGITDKEFSDPDLPQSANCGFPGKKSALWSAEVMRTGCTSEQYIALFNRVGSCGFKDWRLPSATEITTLVSYQAGNLLHDGVYIKDAETHVKGNPQTIRYLTSTPSVDNEASVWCLDAKTKQLMMCHKQQYNHLRLVRGPKL